MKGELEKKNNSLITFSKFLQRYKKVLWIKDCQRKSVEEGEIHFLKPKSKLNNSKVKKYEMTLEILIFNIFTCIFSIILDCK